MKFKKWIINIFLGLLISIIFKVLINANFEQMLIICLGCATLLNQLTDNIQHVKSGGKENNLTKT